MNVVLSLDQETKDYFIKLLWLAGAVAVMVIAVAFLFKKV